MIAALVLLAAGLQNASFEEPGDPPPGWRVGIGANHARIGPATVMVIDREIAREGKASLRLSGDAETMIWHMLTQSAAVRPGERVVFSVAGRCRGLRREAKQFRNANAVLLFFDDEGKRLSIHTSALLDGDRDWVDLHVQALAPPDASEARVGVFSSLSGTVWFDDARLSIVPTSPLDERARRGALEALRLHLDRTYPFFDVPGKPGPDALPLDAETNHFPAALLGMLRPLRDIHVWIRGPKGRLYTGPPGDEPLNANLAAVRKRLDEVVLEGGPHLAGRIGRAGYVRIGSFELQHESWTQSALDRLDDADALILDVRTNGGGDENFAMRVAGRFTDRKVTYVKGQMRDGSLPGTRGFLPPIPRSFGPIEGREPDLRPVVVLQGPYCVSSTEAFLLMMRRLDHVTTLGLPSRGAMANPKPFAVTPEYTVWVSTRRALTPDGKRIEGAGVPPEIRFEAPRGAYDEADPTLEKALELIGK